MARNRFDSRNGGLVDSVVAGVGNQVSGAIQNIGNKNASFSINSVLGGAIQNASGYALNQGQNYLLSQLGSGISNSQSSALANAVTTQIASAGINAAVNFVSQAIPNPFLGGSNVTTAGLGAQAARSSISIPDAVVSQMEAADYGGLTYTLSDIVFTLVPANAGAQTQQPPQTPPIVPLNTGFNASAANSVPVVDAFKSSVALSGPSAGAQLGGSKYSSSARSLGGNADAYRISPLW